MNMLNKVNIRNERVIYSFASLQLNRTHLLLDIILLNMLLSTAVDILLSINLVS